MNDFMGYSVSIQVTESLRAFYRIYEEENEPAAIKPEQHRKELPLPLLSLRSHRHAVQQRLAAHRAHYVAERVHPVD